jgi:hypothetical protein
MFKSKKIVSLIMLMLFSSSVLYASGERPFILRDIRALGMGGAQVGLCDDQNAFFYNPSGITKRKHSMFTVMQMRASLTDDTLDFMDWYDANKDSLDNFDKLSQADQEKITNEIVDKINKYKTRITFGFPNINFISGPIGKDKNTFFGLGLFDQLDIGFKINSGILAPNIDIHGNADLAGMFLFARKLPWYNLSAGLNLKYLSRVSLEENRMSIMAFDGFDPLPQPGHGYGADFGASWDARKDTCVGMSITDLFGTKIKYNRVEDTRKEDNGKSTLFVKDARTGIISPRLNVGVTYKPLKKMVKILFMPDVTFALDFQDITNRDGDHSFSVPELFKNSHMGVELMWKFLALRGGFNQGYPTVGVGVSVWSLKLDYAYYTDEKAMFAGYDPESNHIVSVSWRFGTTLNAKDVE